MKSDKETSCKASKAQYKSVNDMPQKLQEKWLRRFADHRDHEMHAGLHVAEDDYFKNTFEGMLKNIIDQDAYAVELKCRPNEHPLDVLRDMETWLYDVDFAKRKPRKWNAELCKNKRCLQGKTCKNCKKPKCEGDIIQKDGTTTKCMGTKSHYHKNDSERCNMCNNTPHCEHLWQGACFRDTYKSAPEAEDQLILNAPGIAVLTSKNARNLAQQDKQGHERNHDLKSWTKICEAAGIKFIPQSNVQQLWSAEQELKIITFAADAKRREI